MRHPQTAHRRTRGSTLMTTLFMSVITLSFLGSCLAVVSTRYKITTRSRCWNAALPLAEAGIEEALTHIQNDTASSTANGWSATTLGGLPVIVKQRNFSDGSYFYITLYNVSSNNPIVYSTGFVPTPLQTGKYISRTVKVAGTAATASQINVAFGAIQDIQFNGKGVAADSFNSGDPALSTNGQYDPNKTGNNGNFGCLNGTVDFGNHSIQGNIYLAPGAQSQVSAAQVSGKIYSSAKLNFPDVVLPKANWLAAPLTTVGSGKSATTSHDFVLDGDYYVNDSLDITVEPGVSVRVRVDTAKFNPGNVNIQSAAGTSGNLSVFQVSGSCTLSGKITVDSGRALTDWQGSAHPFKKTRLELAVTNQNGPMRLSGGTGRAATSSAA